MTESMQFNGFDDYLKILEWMRESGDTYALADEVRYSTPEMAIQTPQGRMSARPGDRIVKYAAGFTVARSIGNRGYCLWRDPRTGAEHALAPEDVTVVTPTVESAAQAALRRECDALCRSIEAGRVAMLAVVEALRPLCCSQCAEVQHTFPFPHADGSKCVMSTTPEGSNP